MRNATAQKILALSDKNKTLALEIVSDIRDVYELNKDATSYKISLSKPDLIVELGATWLQRTEHATELFNMLFKEGIVTGSRLLEDESIKDNGGLDIELALNKRKFEQLLAGLQLTSAPHIDVKLFEAFELDLSNKELKYDKNIYQFKSNKLTISWVVIEGLFKTYPSPYLLDDTELANADITVTPQALNSCVHKLNKMLKKLTGSNKNLISNNQYVLRFASDLKLVIHGSDPLDFDSQV